MPRTLASVTTAEETYPAFVNIKQRVSTDGFIVTVRGDAHFDEAKGYIVEGHTVAATLTRAEILDLLIQLGELENAIDPK